MDLILSTPNQLLDKLYEKYVVGNMRGELKELHTKLIETKEKHSGNQKVEFKGWVKILIKKFL